jgi:vesicle coat complex subunit
MKSLKKIILIFILIIPITECGENKTGTECGENKTGEVVELLLQAFKSEEPHIRLAAAQALGNIKSEKAVEPLINVLKTKKKENSNLRAEAIKALGKIYSKKSKDRR